MAVPADIFPSSVRGTCHGISAVSGKVGAIFGSYYFDFIKEDGYSGIMSEHPIQYIFIIVTIACVCGLYVTVFFTPKYDGPALEAMDQHVLLDDHKAAIDCLYGKVTMTKEASPEVPLTANSHGAAAQGGVAAACADTAPNIC